MLLLLLLFILFQLSPGRREYYLGQEEHPFMAVDDSGDNINPDDIVDPHEAAIEANLQANSDSWTEYARSMLSDDTWVDETFFSGAVNTFDVSLKLYYLGNDENGEPVLGKPTVIYYLVLTLIIIYILR
jgi:hypothetical protein